MGARERETRVGRGQVGGGIKEEGTEEGDRKRERERERERERDRERVKGVCIQSQRLGEKQKKRGIKRISRLEMGKRGEMANWEENVKNRREKYNDQG